MPTNRPDITNTPPPPAANGRAEQANIRRGYLTGTAATAVANGWAIVAAVISTPLLLGALGTTDFGIWALVQTFSALTGWLSLLDFGLGISATRSVAARVARGDRDDAARAATTAIWLMTATAVVGCALAASVALGVMAAWDPTGAPERFEIVIVVFAVQAAFELVISGMAWVLEGFQRVDRSRQMDVVRRTLVLGAQTVVALITGDLVATVAAGAAASGVAAVVVASMVRAEGVRMGGADRTVTRELVAYGKTISALRPIGVIQRSMDKVLVAVMVGPAAVVGIELATQIHNGAHAVMTSASYTGLAGSAFLHGQQDRQRLRRLVEIGTRFVTLAAWPVAAIAMVVSGPLVDAWVGPAHQDAARLAVVALATILVVSPLQVGSNMLLGTGRAGVNLRLMSFAIVLNLVASIALVAWLGAVGTLLGTLVTSMVIFPMFVVAIANEIQVAPWSFLREAVVPLVVPTALGAAASGAVVLATTLPSVVTVVVAAAVGAGVYAVAALRWGVDRAELALLRGLVGAPR